MQGWRMSTVQGVARCETGTPPGGIKAAENADTTAMATAVTRSCGFNSGSSNPRMAGVVTRSFTPTTPISTPPTPPRNPSKRRFPQNHADDAAALPADGEQDADLLRALEDGHEHGVHHAEHADEDGQQGGAPAHRADHAIALAVADVFAGDDGAGLGHEAVDLARTAASVPPSSFPE